MLASSNGQETGLSLRQYEFDSRLPNHKINAVCPGGEGVVLKTISPKGLAGSNPVYGAIWTVSKVGLCTGLKNQGFPFESETVHQINAGLFRKQQRG